MIGALTLLIFSLAATSQIVARGVAVRGVVHDQTGAVLPGAHMTFLADGTTTPAQDIVTTAAGTFQFERVAPSNYSLRVHFPGFPVHVSRVRVGARPVAPLTIVLEFERVTQKRSLTPGIDALSSAALAAAPDVATV